MSLVAEVRTRVAAAFRRREEEREMDEEIRFHLEMEAEKLVREGMPPREARRRAAIAFGGKERTRERVRAERGLPVLDLVWRDLRNGTRSLAGNLPFSLTLITTLALGISIATMMFSVVDALLLRPLPFQDPDELVEILSVRKDGTTRPYLTAPDGEVWSRQSDIFAAMMATRRASALYTGGGEPLTLPAMGVGAEFHEVLGVRPILGRGFERADMAPGAPAVVLIDHAFWERAFSRDPEVIGREMELEGAPHRIIGVMPAGFRFPVYATTDVWLPIRDDGSVLGISAGPLSYVGRIDGDDREIAQARADAIASSLDTALPREGSWAIRLAPLGESRSGGSGLRTGIAFLGGSVLLLLLAACVNATGLLLLRAQSRTREFAVRVALGASRYRLIFQVVLESLLIGAAASLLAMLVAATGLRVLYSAIPSEVIFFAPFEIAFELRATLLTLFVSFAVALLIGLPPALLATRLGAEGTEGGLTVYATRSRARSGVRRALLFAQVSLSSVMLVGAGLLASSYGRLMAVDPGFRREDVAVLAMSLPLSAYPGSADRAAFLDRVRDRMEAIPGVEAAVINPGVPSASAFLIAPALETEAGPVDSAMAPEILPSNAVDPDFFDVFDVRIVAGRPFDESDAGTQNRIVNRNLARLLWGDADPVGQRFRTDPEGPWFTVVGVVGEMRLMGPDDRESAASILAPRRPDQAPSYVTMAIRTRGEPTPLFPALRSAVHEIDPRQPIEDLRLADDLYGESVALPRFLLQVITSLSAIALLLVVIGIHGTFTFQVLQRRREIGVRLALGARLPRLTWEVAGRGLVLVFVAACIGTVIASAGAQVIRTLLYDVEPTDAASLVSAVVVTVAAGALALLPPVLQARRTDPVEVLRAD